MSNHDQEKSAAFSPTGGPVGGPGEDGRAGDKAAIARLERSMVDVLWRLDLITIRLGIETAKPPASVAVQPPLLVQPPPLPPQAAMHPDAAAKAGRVGDTSVRTSAPAAAGRSDFIDVSPAREPAPSKFAAFASLFSGQAYGETEAAVREAEQRARAAGGHGSVFPAGSRGSHAADEGDPDDPAWVRRWSEPPAPPRDEPTTASSPFDWERLIGGKAFAALGAAAVCIGAVLFLRLAISEGWFSGISPGLRCVLTGLAGFALMGGGEFVRRKYGAAVSTGISAAGIGISYASVLAAWGWYSILGDGVAFSLLACVGGTGVVVAVVSRQPIIAVVGLLGAYMAPVFLYQSSGSILVLPVYLTVLLCAGQVMSLKLRGWFSLSGTLSWWGTLILGGLWSFSKIDTRAGVVLGFLAVVYAVMQGFALLRAAGRQADLTAAGEADISAVSWSDLDVLSLANLEQVFSRGLAPIASFSVAGWCTALGVLAVRRLDPSLDWTAAAVLTVASVVLCGVAAMRAGGTAEVEGASDEAGGSGRKLGLLQGFLGAVQRVLTASGGRLAPVAALAFSLLLQGASLLLVTVALAASDDAAVMVWLAMAVGAVAAGRKLRSVFLDGYGLLMMGIALLRLAHDWLPVNVPGLHDVAGRGQGAGVADTIELFGLHLGAWNLKALLAAITCVAVGRLLLIGSIAEVRRTIARVVAGIGIAVMLAAPLHPETASGAVYAAWGVLMLAATQLHFVDHRLRLPRMVGAVAVPMSVLALASYSMTSPGWTWLPGLPVLHRAMLAIACFVAVLAQCRWLMQRAPCAQAASALPTGSMNGRLIEPLLRVMGYTAVAVAFAATTLEAARITHMVASQHSAAGAGVSIYWSVLAVVCIAAGLALPGVIRDAGDRSSRPRGVIGFFLEKSRRGAEDDGPLARAGTLATVLRRVGLGLLIVTLLKVVIIDLASIGGLWRVASFLATGGLMIGVAMAYARLEKVVIAAK